MANLFSVKGKNIIVTGAARGNGLAIARGLHELGTNVIAIDKDKIPDENPYRFFNVQRLDLTEMRDIKDFRHTCDELDILIQGLINNAGVSLTGVPWTPAYWDDTFNVNLRGVYNLSSQLHNLLAEDASIINIASLSAVQGFPNNPAYCASKG